MILVGTWSLNLKTQSLSLRQASTTSTRRRCLQLCADIEMRAKRFCRWTVGVGFWARGWTVRGSCGCRCALSISLVLEIRLEVLDSPYQSCACRGLTLGTFKKPSFEPFCVWFLGTLPDRSSQIPYKLVPFFFLLRLVCFLFDCCWFCFSSRICCHKVKQMLLPTAWLQNLTLKHNTDNKRALYVAWNYVADRTLRWETP